MPIRICRAGSFGLATVSLWLLAGCATGQGSVPAQEPAAAADTPTALANAEAALARGDFPQAARAWREAAEKSDDETVAEQATRVAFDHAQWHEGAASAARWLELNPTSESARRHAGLAALELHRLDAAEEQFALLLESAYISPAAGFLALAPLLDGEGAPTDVMELMRRLSARHPEVAEGLYAHGSAALRADNFAAAEKSARAAVAKAPYWKPAKMLLARTLVAAGSEEEGLAMARDLVMADGSDLATHLEYALMLAATGRDEEARAMLVPYTSGRTVIPGAVRTLGAMELDAGNLDAATQQFENLLATGAQSYEALYYLGVIAERRDDDERAVRYYERVTASDYRLPAQQRVARIKADTSGVDAGIAYLDELARAAPHLAPQVWASKAALLEAEGESRRAGKVYDESLVRYPDSLDLRMSRVFHLERVGKRDEAIRELRAMLAERPGDAQLQNALGYTLADADRNLGEARELISAALAQSPDNAAMLDSMGWLLYREGRYDEALKYLQRASTLGGDPEIDLHIGEVQWAAGNKDAARATWRAALEGAPENDRLRDRLERAGP